MSKRDDCKRFYVIPNVGVKDDLTGEVLTSYKDFAKALNCIVKKADNIAEKYYDLLFSIE